MLGRETSTLVNETKSAGYYRVEFDARDLVREEARAITSIRLHACEICGETLPEREGKFCITCQRRGRVESHIPGAVAGP